MVYCRQGRRRRTRYWRDWSSDVCSADLGLVRGDREGAVAIVDDAGAVEHCAMVERNRHGDGVVRVLEQLGGVAQRDGETRSEERRVGKECRSRWWPYH